MTEVSNVSQIPAASAQSSTTNPIVADELKKTKLYNIFEAARTTAKGGEQNISVFDSDGDGKLSATEMENAVRKIQAENAKTVNEDKYTGKEKGVENSDATKNAFKTLDEADFYDWTGKKGDNQHDERIAQVTNNERDAAKAARIMLDKLVSNDKFTDMTKEAQDAQNAAAQEAAKKAEEAKKQAGLDLKDVKIGGKEVKLDDQKPNFFANDFAKNLSAKTLNDKDNATRVDVTIDASNANDRDKGAKDILAKVVEKHIELKSEITGSEGNKKVTIPGLENTDLYKAFTANGVNENDFENGKLSGKSDNNLQLPSLETTKDNKKYFTIHDKSGGVLYFDEKGKKLEKDPNSSPMVPAMTPTPEEQAKINNAKSTPGSIKLGNPELEGKTDKNGYQNQSKNNYKNNNDYKWTASTKPWNSGKYSKLESPTHIAGRIVSGFNDDKNEEFILNNIYFIQNKESLDNVNKVLQDNWGSSNSNNIDYILNQMTYEKRVEAYRHLGQSDDYYKQKLYDFAPGLAKEKFPNFTPSK